MGIDTSTDDLQKIESGKYTEDELSSLIAEMNDFQWFQFCGLCLKRGCPEMIGRLKHYRGETYATA